jgi:hypothetical protein
MSSIASGMARHAVALARAMRRNGPDRRGVICLTPDGLPLLRQKAPHKVGQFKEISDPKRRPTLAQDHLRVGRDDVGPLRRHRADAIVVGAQQQPLPVAIVAFADAHELSSAERVKRVHNAHKAPTCVRRACSSC